MPLPMSFTKGTSVLALLQYPDMSPEIFSIGGFAVRWYALAYIGGLLLGHEHAIYVAKCCKTITWNNNELQRGAARPCNNFAT